MVGRTKLLPLLNIVKNNPYPILPLSCIYLIFLLRQLDMCRWYYHIVTLNMWWWWLLCNIIIYHLGSGIDSYQGIVGEGNIISRYRVEVGKRWYILSYLLEIKTHKNSSKITYWYHCTLFINLRTMIWTKIRNNLNPKVLKTKITKITIVRKSHISIQFWFTNEILQ